MIVRCAMEFSADIKIRNDATGFEADAKSPLEVMMLNAPCGTMLTILGSGTDAGAAVDAIKGLIEAGFNEDDK
ncbi:MAG: phosphotransferase system HPr (HPr) family protein [Planctomycetota bacterium]|jgi:phosphotransferase system HPr (HPr) family protein